MESKLKVGDRIRVFEIQSGHYQPKIHGKHSAERVGKYLGNQYGVDLCYGFNWLDGSYSAHHANIDNKIVKKNHIKHVCTMVITKLK